MHQVISDWQNWCRNLSAFREEAMRQTVVFDCSAEPINGMTCVKDAEYSWCLPTSRMYRNVENIYGICHESRCIIIHKLANELGIGLFHQIFHTRLNL